MELLTNLKSISSTTLLLSEDNDIQNHKQTNKQTKTIKKRTKYMSQQKQNKNKNISKQSKHGFKVLLQHTQ